MIRFKDLYVSLEEDHEHGEHHPRPRTACSRASTAECTQIVQLHHLKEHLLKALALTVELERESEEGPRTVEEAELLETKLQGALEELRQRKAELERDVA
jgi:hypothetical protein